jgi:transcription termination factor Rho
MSDNNFIGGLNFLNNTATIELPPQPEKPAQSTSNAQQPQQNSTPEQFGFFVPPANADGQQANGNPQEGRTVMPPVYRNNRNANPNQRHNNVNPRHSSGEHNPRHNNNRRHSSQHNNMQVGDVADFNDNEEVITADAKIISTNELRSKDLETLMKIATDYNVLNTNRMLKQDIICAILKQAGMNGEIILAEGVIETVSDGFGFIRSVDNNYVPSPEDVCLPPMHMKKFGIRTGDTISCYAREPRRNEKHFSMIKFLTINGQSLDQMKNKINFDNLVPLYPNQQLNLDINIGAKEDCSTRIIDVVAPLGKGQRALIVAPPRTGKTVLLQNIAFAINKNHPEVKLIYLGIDERPEEFTEMKRTIKGEVVSSTFDEPATRHVALAEIVIEKAKRMVEDGQDVVILLDSITRLARAYNAVMPSSGKVLTGGVDSNALQKPKRFFGAARNIEHGGSLTIIGTALVDTGSKMDEVIFEEFKGTGNSEIVLDRKIADKRLFPAINILSSGTRKEEEMIDAEKLSKMWVLRRIVTKMGDQVTSSAEALEFLMREIKKSKDNADFFTRMNG